jgi:hypothetical protein
MNLIALDNFDERRDIAFARERGNIGAKQGHAASIANGKD